MKTGKVIFAILLTATIVGGAYYGVRAFRRRKKPVNAGTGSVNVTTPEQSGVLTSNPDPVFPISFGSRGQYVADIQRALMILFPGSLPKYGADGDWGKETEAALKEHNFPTVIRKADYDRIMGAARAKQPPQTVAGGGTHPSATVTGGGVASWF